MDILFTNLAYFKSQIISDDILETLNAAPWVCNGPLGRTDSYRDLLTTLDLVLFHIQLLVVHLIQFCYKQFAGAVLLEVACVLLSYTHLQVLHLQELISIDGKPWGGVVSLEQDYGAGVG